MLNRVTQQICIYQSVRLSVFLNALVSTIASDNVVGLASETRQCTKLKKKKKIRNSENDEFTDKRLYLEKITYQLTLAQKASCHVDMQSDDEF